MVQRVIGDGELHPRRHEVGRDRPTRCSGAPPLRRRRRAAPGSPSRDLNPDPNFHDRELGTDNAGIAYGSSKGIEVSRFTQFGPGLCAAPDDSILSPTGSRPTGAPPPPASTYGRPARNPPAAVDPAPQPAPKAGIALSKTTRKALRKGLAVKVTVPGAGKVKLVATAKGKTVASGTATSRPAS